MSGGVWDKLREPVDDFTKSQSQNIKHLGQDWNIPLLEEEGAKNEKNPGRAYGKAAQAIASWYVGGALGAAGGAGSGAAANSAALAGDADMAAIQAGMTGSQQLAQQAAMQGGLLDAVPQGFGNTMESGMTDTGYTPSSLRYALKNASSANGTSLGQNIGNLAGQKYMDAQSGAMMNRATANLTDNKRMAYAGSKLLMQQPQPMPPPPRPMPQQSAPMQTMYGESGMGGQQLDEETKRRLRAMGFPI